MRGSGHWSRPIVEAKRGSTAHGPHYGYNQVDDENTIQSDTDIPNPFNQRIRGHHDVMVQAKMGSTPTGAAPTEKELEYQQKQEDLEKYGPNYSNPFHQTMRGYHDDVDRSHYSNPFNQTIRGAGRFLESTTNIQDGSIDASIYPST